MRQTTFFRSAGKKRLIDKLREVIDTHRVIGNKWPPSLRWFLSNYNGTLADSTRFPNIYLDAEIDYPVSSYKARLILIPVVFLYSTGPY